ncbi:hypothetical protein D3C87_2157540 [compost metagenome]
MDKITVAQDAEGDDLKLTTVETAESLKAAPEFKSLSQQSAEADANTNSAMPTDNSTTSSTTKP